MLAPAGDLGMRYFDVVDVTNLNNKIFFEFKSVGKVPPSHFKEQFLKDLNNKEVTSLDQIKWIFDGRKNPVGTKQSQSFKEAMEEAIEGLTLNNKTAQKFGKNNPEELKDLILDNLDKIFDIK